MEKCQSDYSNVSVQELRKEIKMDIKIREWKIEDKSELAGNLNIAQNMKSVRLAEKLGYEFDHEYTAYEVTSGK